MSVSISKAHDVSKIGRPLETIIPGAEGCERGKPRELAQNSMPRFIAFHPALFLVFPGYEFSGNGCFRGMLPAQVLASRLRQREY
jgi:hypothetical protein